MTVNDGNVSLVMNTLAGTNLRKLATLFKANESGSDAMLRQGVLLDLYGIALRESAGVVSHVKGAGTGYDFVVAGEAVGQTTLSVSADMATWFCPASY
jgi:hypothetical protein